MAYDRRIDYYNAWHHVMNRGAGSKKIFYSAKDREKFLSILAKVNAQYDLEIHAYCLMGNHYHLLVKSNEAKLSDGIRYLDGVYAKHYNYIRHTDGPLFRGRFKSCIIEDGQYLLDACRYIHLNPVKANMVTLAKDYYWSSMSAYLDLSIKPKWLTTTKVLSFFPDIMHFQHFTDTENDNDSDEGYEYKNWNPLLGSSLFQDTIKNFYSDSFNKTNQAHLLNATKQPSVKTIQEIVATYYNVSLESIVKPSFMSENTPRMVAMWLSQSAAKHNLSSIAHSFNIRSKSGISMAILRLKNRLKKEFSIAQDIAAISNALEK